MRNTSLIIVFLIFSCNTNHEENIIGVWHSKFSVNQVKADTVHLGSEENFRIQITNPNENSTFNDTFLSNQVYFIDGDSINITVFNETLYYGHYSSKLNYNITADSLLLEDIEGNPFLMTINKLTDDQMVLSYDNSKSVEYDRIVINSFVKLNKYFKGNQKDSVYSSLVESKWQLKNVNQIIELTPYPIYNGDIYTDDMDYSFGLNNRWYLTEYKDELLLILGDKIVQIKEFTDSKITGIVFPNEKIVLDKYDDIQINNLDTNLIFGKWVNSKIALKNENDKNIDSSKFDIYSIEISDKLIFRNSTIGIDTIEWSFNKYKDKIAILTTTQYMWHSKGYWNLLNLTDQELKIELTEEKESNPASVTFTFKKK